LRRAFAVSNWRATPKFTNRIKNVASFASFRPPRPVPADQFLDTLPPTEITKLTNGLRVASETSNLKTATIGVFIDAGSSFETKQNNGTAHFLEHLAFKGTEKRTKVQLEQEIENMGGSLNAYTSREQTVYYARVFKEDVPKAVEILSDIVLHSKYTDESIEQERGVILREMQEVEKQVEEVMFDHLHSIAFQECSLGQTILGPPENIRKIRKADIEKYVRSYYSPSRMVIAGAGGVDHKQLTELAAKHFQFPANKDTAPELPKPVFTGSSVLSRDDENPKAHAIVAFPSVSWSDPDFFSLMLLQVLLGSWDKTSGGGRNLCSNLCEQVATKDLATKISSFNTAYREIGVLGVYAETSKEDIDSLVWEICNEFSRLANKLSEQELNRAKNKLYALTLMSIDGTTATCEDIGRQVLTLGSRISPAQVLNRIAAIDVKTFQKVISRCCYDTDPAVVGLGAVETFPDYTQIRGWTYWNRY